MTTEPTPNKTIVLCPGPVISRDGDVHHINEHRLARLYGVRLADCLVADEDGYCPGAPDDAVYLGPRDDGRYAITRIVGSGR